VFEQKPESSIPTLQDKVMHELDMAEGRAITSDVLREALTTVAMKNGRPLDAKSIDKLAAELLDGQTDLPRDKLRKALDGFTQ
jgi:hypothetical protein